MIRHVGCLLLALALSLPALAVENEEVRYAGGSIAGAKVGAVGHLDLSSADNLTFESPGARLAIPYAAIESFDYSEEVKRHLGLLPALGVNLIRHREKRHMFRILFHDRNDVEQVAIFEVSKHAQAAVQAVLNVRAPHRCARPAACGTKQ